MSATADHYCLRSKLTWRLVTLQAALLIAIITLVIGALWACGLPVLERDEDRVMDIVRTSLGRDDTGRLVLRPTVELKQLREETPDLWFLVRDRQGETLSEGKVPDAFTTIGGALDHISQARLGWQMFEDDPRKPPARMKRVNTDVGNVQIISATQGPISGV